MLPDEDYFETIGISIISGRGFTGGDDADAPRVAIVSQGMSARYWPNESPLGKRIHLTASQEWAQVIGVAADIKFGLFTPRSTPLLYLPRLQHPSGRSTLLVRTTGEAASVATSVRAAFTTRIATCQFSRCIGLGVVGSVGAAGLIRGVIPRTSVDVMTFVLIVPAVVGIAVLATYIPARRAARIDPLVALRRE